MSKEAFGLPRQTLQEAGFFPKDGSKFRELKGLSELLRFVKLVQTRGRFRERFGENGAETDPSFQQLIMYAVIFDTKGRFLLYERSKGPGYSEGRLAGKVSMGVGGHMEAHDKNLPRSLYRELSEEIEVLEDGKPVDTSKSKKGIKDYLTIHAVGVIKDDGDPVGEVHFGVVCFVDSKRDNVEVRIRTEEEAENTRFAFVSDYAYNELIQSGQVIPEAWTQIVQAMVTSITPEGEKVAG